MEANGFNYIPAKFRSMLKRPFLKKIVFFRNDR